MKFVQPLWTVLCQFLKKLNIKYLHKRIEHICPYRDIVVHSPSHVQFFVTPWTAAHQASLSLTTSRSLPKFMSIALVMPSSHLILWCPLLPLPSIFPSIRDFFSESAVHIRWLKYWRFSFSISPSIEYSELISLKIDWFDLLAVQGTLRSLFQHHSLKASMLLFSAFFKVLLSQLYVTTGKTIWTFVLTIKTFVSRVMSLLFNTLSRFIIAFLPKSNHLLISWLHSPSTVILEPMKRKSVTTTFPPSVCHEITEPDAIILVFFLLIFSFKPALSLFSFTFIKRLCSFSLLSAIRVVSSTYLRLLMFLPPVLIPACNSSSPAFLMMCSAYRLTKQDDSRQPCHSPFSILNQLVVPYRVLTIASWLPYRFVRRQVSWSGIPISELSTVCYDPYSQRL